MQLNGVIQRKLALLDTQVMRLKQHLGGVTLEAFADDWVLRSMAERALQVAVEIVIDVAARIIALQGGGPVATAAEGIERLVATGVLASAEPFKNMVRFRNLIVHEYEVIDPTVLYDIVVNRLDDFRLFRDQIDRLC
jgi:uncharacterized protein YutE (UPF0331/DUF86 family)